MIEIKAALAKAVSELEVLSDSARLDAEILLAHCLKKSRTWLYTYPEATLSQEEWQRFQDLVCQRAKGLPIAHLTGTREFWSLPLKVSKDTLIPRPETELLVELSLKLLADKPQAQILDLGTGSGAIAIACAFERPNWQINACDCNFNALEIAKENALRLGLGKINFFLSDWFEKIPENQKFDAIISNPPYIAANDPHLNQGDLRFEPSLALVSGEDGLTAIEHIIQQSLARLKPDGLLLLEHGFNQKSEIRSMLSKYGYCQVQCWQDWQGNDRVSAGIAAKNKI